MDSSQGPKEGLYSSQGRADVKVRKYARQIDQARAGAANKQGTVMGVIFPCMQNILGVLLFLRLPWIVGVAGIGYSMLLVGITCTCTFITALSLSAVATNGKILAGGSYFLISRSLGPALGAGVGLCFYCANSIGAAMYIIGTVEAWEIANPDLQILEAGSFNNIRVTGYIVWAFALAAVGGGLKYVARLGTAILFVVLLVIVFMYVGALSGPRDWGEANGSFSVFDRSDPQRPVELTRFFTGPRSENVESNWGAAWEAEQSAFPSASAPSFISLLALWFPAVTGIMAGSNRSADLENPSASIPKGTIFAQVVTSVIYVSFCFVFGCTAPRESLLDDKFYAATSAFPNKTVVMYGVMLSSLGAALQSLISASRLLSAISGDGTLPILKSFAIKPGKEPTRALLASGFISFWAVTVADLNIVNPIITMFFLLCYFCINMCCALLEALEDPNWRPRFQYHHWSVSLAGMCLCATLMILISWYSAIAAICIAGSIFMYAQKNSQEVQWGDGWTGMRYQLARRFLETVQGNMHIKAWRPQVLVLTGVTIDEHAAGLLLHDMELVHFASQLKHGQGLCVVGGLCYLPNLGRGSIIAKLGAFNIRNWASSIQSNLNDMGVDAFAKIVYTPNRTEGISALIQTTGMGGLSPNCILASWPFSWVVNSEARVRFISTLQACGVFGKAVIIAKEGHSFPKSGKTMTAPIDIWWLTSDGGLLLILPFLLQKHQVWRQCRIRLYTVISTSDDPVEMKAQVQSYVDDFRLPLEVHTVQLPPAVLQQVGSRTHWRRGRARSDPQDEASPAHREGNMMTDPGPRGGLQAALGAAIRQERENPFAVSEERLTSSAPCDGEMLDAAKSLNKVFQKASASSSLLITNLLPIPRNLSAFGYMQFQEHLTADLTRVLLVRGTQDNVMTEFT
mmetsp:Transcript_52564/g.115284  ORF Transcript_52564/g.115284 Transcript_52564/m.115284 type:complete len:911 (+) Transcript_52564:19-2751(+)